MHHSFLWASSVMQALWIKHWFNICVLHAVKNSAVMEQKYKWKKCKVVPLLA